MEGRTRRPRVSGGGVRGRGGRDGGAADAAWAGGEEGVAAGRGRAGRTRGGARGRGVLTRGGQTESGRTIDAVEIEGRGLNTGRGAGLGKRRPFALETPVLVDITTMPSTPPMEEALTKRKKRSWPPLDDGAGPSHGLDGAGPSHSSLAAEMSDPVAADAADDAAAAAADDLLPSSSIRYLGSESEAESDAEDGEYVPPLFIPRTVRMFMDTPLVEDEDKVTAPELAADFQPPHSDHPEESSPPPPAAATATGGMEYGPDFYNFVWQAFPNPPLDPRLRREAFDESNVGPTTPCVDPYSIFMAIWDHAIMEHIVSETNEYARELVEFRRSNNTLTPKSRLSEWRDTTTDELYTYLALVLAMGCLIKSRLEAYWSVDPNIFSTAQFRSFMPLRRFQLLSRCLHFNRNSRLNELNVTTSSEAKIFKVKPVVDHLNRKFPEMYRLQRNIALDESLLQWKGWLSFNQFIPNKAATIGIKTYEICESQTGYLWRFEIHSHKYQQKPSSSDPLEASTPAIVLRLLDGLQNRGHTVWMDNFYNSPALARKLKTLGFDSVGTLRTNHQFVPEDLHQLTKEEMRPGQITGLTSGDVDVIVWRDKNRVAALSTYHGNTVSMKYDSMKPNLILDYNIMMGGVDKKDQMLAMYPVERKRTRIWYKKFFRRLLNISVLNAYIISKKSSSSLTHAAFREKLIVDLLEKHAPKKQEVVARPDMLSILQHHLAHLPFPPSGQSRRRRTCGICKKMVTTYCVGCDKAFCLTPCFLQFHTSRKT